MYGMYVHVLYIYINIITPLPLPLPSSLHSALMFIRDLTAESLTMDPTVFNANYAAAQAALDL